MSTGIPFTHRIHSRAKRIKITLDANGEVIVTTPPHFPHSKIPPFLEEAREWIRVNQEKHVHSPVLLDQHSVLYFGMNYDVIVSPAQDGNVQIGLNEMTIAPFDTSSTGVIHCMEQWLKARAAEYIIPQTKLLATRMGVQYNVVRFREQKTRWGSCSADKNINFNWRLIHAPKAVIDYVIIHELTHTVHMNHGNHFWDMVAQFDPDHPLHRGWLKRMGGEEE